VGTSIADLFMAVRPDPKVGEFKVAGRKAGDQFGDSFEKSAEKGIRRGVESPSKFGDLGGKAGTSFGLKFSEKIGPILAQAPISPPLIAAAAAAIPAIGAAVSAGLLLALGGGVLAAGIASAARDPKVAAAFSGLGDKAKKAMSGFGDPFKAPLIRAAKTFGDSLERIAPAFLRMGQTMAPLIDKLAPALAQLAEKAMPGIEKAVAASVPLFEKLAEHAPAIGAAMSKFFTKIAEGAPAAIKFIDVILKAAAVVLPLLGTALNQLTGHFNATWAIWRGIFNGIRAGFRAVQTTVSTVWAAVRGVFGAMSTGIGLVRSAFHTAVAGIVNTFQFLLQGARTYWGALQTVIGTVSGVVRGMFTRLGSAIGTLREAFRAGVAGIAKIWGGLQNAAKNPVNFVIGTVINRGIIGPLRTLLGWIPGAGGLKDRLKNLPTLARGGPVRRPAGGPHPLAPAGDDQLAWVGEGEEVISKDKRRRYAGLIEAIQSGTLPSFARGGTVGGPFDWLGAGAKALSNPLGWLKDKAGAGRITEQFGNSLLVQGLSRIPAAIIEKAVGWIKTLIGIGPGGGGASLGSGGGSAIANIMAIARSIYPGARMSSGFRRGDKGYHGQGLAADIIGGGATGMAHIARGFYAIGGRLLELIHSGGGGFFIKNGRRVSSSYYRSVIAGHYNHVHVAKRANADNGADLMPGWNPPLYNGTGAVERLRPVGSGGVMVAAGAVQITVYAQNAAGVEAAVDNAFGRLLERIEKGRHGR